MAIIPKQPLVDDDVISYWIKKPTLSTEGIVPLILGVNPFACNSKEPAYLNKKQDIEDMLTLISHREIVFCQLTSREPLEFWRDSLKKLDLILPNWLNEYLSKDELKQAKKEQRRKELAEKETPEMREKRSKETIKSLEEAKVFLESVGLDPFTFSNLDKYLSLDSWGWKDGLLLLAGGNPEGANINWNGYENILGAHINKPKVNDMGFLDCSWGDADTPADFSLGDDEDYFRGNEMIEKKVQHLNLVEHRLQENYEQWVNALKAHPDRNEPAYYIDWARSKNIYIEWLDWAIDKGFYKPSKQQDEKPLKQRERNSLLRIIGAMSQTLLEKEGDDKGKTLFNSQNELISYLSEQYEGYEGLSKSNLEDRLKAAKDLLS